MERENVQETKVNWLGVDCCGGTCGSFQDCESGVSALACGGDASLAWGQYLDATQTDLLLRSMTRANRLYTHLAILAGRHPCKPHTALRSGFTLTGWLWREFPMCSASGWMVSRVQYGESGGAWSECAATNETPTTRSKRARKIRSANGDANLPASAAVDRADIPHGTAKKPSKKGKKVETQAQCLLPCT